MTRKLKHHEQKLLRKVDFLQWKNENPREQTMVGRFHMQNREDYIKYNKICGHLTRMASLLSQLAEDDPFRTRLATQLLDKLYDCGLISHKQHGITQLTRVTVASLCKRRLASILVSLKMSENMGAAVQLIQQGHVRVGPETIQDPSFFVTRTMEDFVTWVDQSKIKRKIAVYHNNLDDFDMSR